jgi:hypothetical protein
MNSINRSNDSKFHAFVKNFVEYSKDNFAELQISEEYLNLLTEQIKSWEIASEEQVKAQAAARIHTASKVTARKELERMLSDIGSRVAKSPLVPDIHREALGLTVRPANKVRVTSVSSVPVIEIGFTQRLRHTLTFLSTENPQSKRRPAGTIGVELWCKKGGAAPQGLNDCQDLGLVTGSKKGIEFQPADAGMTVHYVARWINRSGEPAPLGSVYSAMIVG